MKSECTEVPMARIHSAEDMEDGNTDNSTEMVENLSSIESDDSRTGEIQYVAVHLLVLIVQPAIG